MAFDFSTLITDRTLEDVANKTAKGFYNATDLNRVDACLEDLVARLSRVGCNIPGYERVKIERAVTPSSRLPEGYTELEYIRSDGGQHIDALVTPTQNTRVNIKFSTSETGSHTVFGSDIDWTENGFALGVGFAHYGKANRTISGLVDGNPHDVDFKKNVIAVDGATVSTMEIATFSLSYNLAVFANNRSGSIQEKTKMALYYCKIYENENAIRDFIPCQDPSGNIGLYDVISGEFYGNAGTGVFLAGPVVERPKDPNEDLDPYTWYESDVPTASLLARYRDNVAAVRTALRLPEGTPGVPETMRRLTTAEANSIEAILLALNLILNKIHTAVRHCGVTVCGSKGVRA